MNASQLVTWAVCLVLALFASVLALRNAYQIKMVERRLDGWSNTAQAEVDLLADTNQVLKRIEVLLQEATSKPPPLAPAQTGPAR